MSELVTTNNVALPEAAVSVVTKQRRFGMLGATLREAWRFARTKIGVITFGVIVVLPIFGPLFAPYSPTELVTVPYSTPSSQVLLGSDVLGRDVLSRVLYGGRTVIGLALVATAIGMVLGIGLGLAAGYGRRWLDETVMRILDVVLAFPQLILVLVFVSIAGPRLWLVVLLVGVSHTPRVARVARAATLEVVQRDFVRASEALGVSRIKIALTGILPNVSSPLLVEFGLRLTYSIALIAALSFMGFGMQPPAADWGLMINENRMGIVLQPWAVVVPVVLIAILTIGTNFASDGLNRALTGVERDTGGK